MIAVRGASAREAAHHIVDLGRGICTDLTVAEGREWLVTNGLGSFASGTIAGTQTRRYHGLLIAAPKAPSSRTYLVAKLDETVAYDERTYALATNRWRGGAIEPQGFRYLERFVLDGAVPVWTFVPPTSSWKNASGWSRARTRPTSRTDWCAHWADRPDDASVRQLPGLSRLDACR